MIPIIDTFVKHGFSVVATGGTASALQEAGVPCQPVNKVRQGRPHIVDMIKNNEIAFIINTTEDKQAIADSYTIRRNALQHKVNYTTTLAGAWAVAQVLEHGENQDITCLQELHNC